MSINVVFIVGLDFLKEALKEDGENKMFFFVS